MLSVPEKFAEVFNAPSVAAMHALSPHDFERFVAYVLRRAGYDVKEVGFHFLHGVDLEMRIPGNSEIIGGVECKRFEHDQLISASIVRGVKGAHSVEGPNAKPFVITTSDFNDAAHQVAEIGSKRAYLMNGSQLVRYIQYVRGSRYDDESTNLPISPEYFAGRERTYSYSAQAAKILTVANNKGGVGKTTTAYYLGAELARMGKRVLLIDLDGQANLTESCFPEQAIDPSDAVDHFPNISQYFSEQRTLQELIVSTGKDNLSIIPSDPLLRLRDLGGNGRPDVELRFALDVLKLSVQPLASLGGTADWIIIDTPPAMSVFTRAGLAAADFVLAPVRPRRRSIPGTRMMLTTLQTMNTLMNNHARFLGVVITHWDNLKLSHDFETILLPPELRKYGGRAFTEKIPIDNQLEYLEPGARTGGAKAYASLAAEVLKRVMPQ